MTFFTANELIRKTRQKINVESMQPDCLKCNLWKDCKTKKMKVSGDGKKKILIIGDNPTIEDDEYGSHLVGEDGQLFKKTLKKIDIILNRDCWKVNAVNCNTPKNRVPSHKEIKCCYPYVEQTIKKLKPKLIVLLGPIAITSLLGNDFSNRKINTWRAYEIPDETFNCFIIPIFHPSYIVERDKDLNLKSLFDRDINRIDHCLKRTFAAPKNYEKYVTNLTTFRGVTHVLKRILKRKSKIAFDYETTGLKPYREGHKIVTIGLAVSAKKAFAFPFNYKTYWTDKEFKVIKNLWKKILSDKKIKKIAQNSKFEEIWSRVLIGTRPRWHWDTLMAEHIMDNRRGCTGLKFQTYVRYGIRPYDKIINPYLKSKNGEFNTVEQAPFKELLIYNGLDCIYCWMRYKDQTSYLPKMKNMFSAYKFFMQGLRTMGTIQYNGISVDTKYFDKTKEELAERIITTKQKLLSGRESRKFKEKYGRQLNITSNPDLGKLFFDVLGKSPVYTAKGNYKTDKGTLESLNLPFVDSLLEMKRLEKAKGTYLAQFSRESYKEKMHPFFDLHIPVSYRGCIAKGTKILVARNFESHPKGIPIENVKAGDNIYCFDDDLNPQIKPVVKAWKTGYQEIIRVHYYRKGGHDYIDCTPDHRIRLIDGTYIQAKDLKKGDRTLAGSRHKDSLNFTNHLKNGNGLYEHRFIYSQLIGDLKDSDVVHHIDENHLNHDSINLEKHTRSSHAKKHYNNTLGNKQSRVNNVKAVKKGWKNGDYKDSIRYVSDHSAWLGLSALQCMKMLVTCKGQVKIAADHFNVDFETFKKYLKQHNIDAKLIKLRYDKNGIFISKGRLLELSKLGRKKVQKILGHNYYKLIDLYNFYKIDSKRKWGNQFGEFKPGNHIITNIEYLNRKEDVYDIEVKDCPNFFANEICVHNSSSMPNFQNLPKRDPEIGKLIRKGIVPSKNCVIIESDFSGAEVITSASYHLDKQFIHDITEGDMHRDLATELFLLPENMLADAKIKGGDAWSKSGKKIRFFGKNNWTFAQFYGDWFGSCGQLLWENVVESGLLLPDLKTSVKKWLTKKGIFELGEIDEDGPTPGSFLEHCKKVETKMWEDRFPDYTQWKKDVVEGYQRWGYVETYLGFRFQGYMDRKQCTNYPIQGTSFHLLVYSLNKVGRFLEKHKLKTKLIGQIHDSIVLDAHKEEITFVTQGIEKIVGGLQNTFKWLVVPLEMEYELSDLREDGGNFANMTEYSLTEINKMY